MSKLNLLVVEDQSGPLQNLSLAIREVVFGEEIRNMSSESHQRDLEERGVDVARGYSEAEAFVGNKEYDAVFLDHRLPYRDQGDLEETDFRAFSHSLEEIGYGLIPQIKERNPETVVIGTSSLHGDALRKFQKPDYQLDKISMDLEEDLAEILEEVRRNE